MFGAVKLSKNPSFLLMRKPTVFYTTVIFLLPGPVYVKGSYIHLFLLLGEVGKIHSCSMLQYKKHENEDLNVMKEEPMIFKVGTWCT